MLERARNYRDYWFYRRRKRGIERAWQQRHRKVMSLHPEYRRACPEELEQKHLAIWRSFSSTISLDTIRVCWNIAGSASPQIIPEEIFAGDIERCLAHPDWPPVLAHKSLYTRFFSAEIFPECYLHNIDGEFLDAALEPLGRTLPPNFLERLEYPVVLKPNTDSCGGKGISFPNNPEELWRSMEGRSDFLVQRRLRQHPWLEAFNSCGLNTVRVYTYKSVLTDQVHVLNAALRMGKGGSLDNETAGGIVCYIGAGGVLNDYAVDRYGEKFDRHPDSGLVFGPPQALPNFAEMTTLARRLAAALPKLRLAGWDMCLDNEGRWRCLEVNLASHTIRFAQYAGHAFFGEFTDEVIRYCLRHPMFRRAAVRIS